MATMTVYNAFSIPRIPSTKAPTTAIPTNVPQHKPFASQRKLQSFAFNPAIDTAALTGLRRLPFIRPDVPPVSDDSFKSRRDYAEETTAEASFKARPQFRSALEQVSFVTNNKLWENQKSDEERRANRLRLGIFGL